MPEASSLSSGRPDEHGVSYILALMSKAMTSKKVGLTFLASALALVVLVYLFGVSLAALCVAFVAGAATVFNVCALTIRDIRDLRGLRPQR